MAEFIVNGWMTKAVIFVVEACNAEEAKEKIEDGDWDDCIDGYREDWEIDETSIKENV